MWRYKPEGVALVRNFFRMSLDDMWTALFKPFENTFPDAGDDYGLDANNGPSEVR